MSNGLVKEAVLYNIEDIPVVSDSSLLENIEHIRVDVVDVEENVASLIPQSFAVGSRIVEMRIDPQAPSNDKDIRINPADASKDRNPIALLGSSIILQPVVAKDNIQNKVDKKSILLLLRIHQ